MSPPEPDLPGTMGELGRVRHRTRFDENGHADGKAIREDAADFKKMAMAKFYIPFEALQEKDAQAVMGSAWRSSITGQVLTKHDSDYPNYRFADFWTRKTVNGSITDLMKDPYCFRPVPMKYRTWMYHFFFLQKMVIKGGGSDHAMIQHVLSHRTQDVDIQAGRWSPLVAYAPMLLVMTITGDIYAVLAGIIMCWLLWLVATSTNTPSLHRYHRVISFPFRVFFLLFTFSRLQAMEEALGLLAFFVCIILLLAEIVCGDINTILSYRLECNYEIVRVLPNRVFICRRHGASHLEETFGKRGTVKECISGFAVWERSMTLIADIGGMLVELRPMREEDWRPCHEDFCMVGTPLPYFSLNIFDEDWPSAMDAERGGNEGIKIVQSP
mmetsp:Transcript_73460/g.192653  ORF Transcript_73460/g.192653 Transcript_73460/m.192653 type:complete len:384 (-) Transcript_73460:187-1338(-)